MSNNIKTSSAFDIKKHASHLEEAYRRIWKSYLDGNPPETIRVN